MPGLESEIDANFYCMVHERMYGESSGTDDNRRHTARRRAATRHRVAPYNGGDFPAAEEFFAVETYDLDQGGFSFFFDRPIECPRMMVDFGSPESPIWVEAELRHCELVLRHSENQIEYVCSADEASESDLASDDPRHVCLVGCRFVRRLLEDEIDVSVLEPQDDVE